MRSEDVAAMVAAAVRAHSMNSARTAQSMDNRLGASEIGVCRSYLWRVIRQEPRADEGDNWKAFLGTAIGGLLEEAVSAEYSVHTQDEVACELPSGRLVPGHVDVWTEPYLAPLPEGFVGATDPMMDPGSVWDFKAKDGVLLMDRDEPDRSHTFQIALYHRALVQAGKIDEDAPAFIVYVDRSGKTSTPIVKQVDVTDELIAEIDSWIEDAIYGAVNDEEPSRDRPYEWCKVACPFFDACRGADEQHAEGLLTDPHVLVAVDAYRQGLDMEKAAKKLKDEAHDALLGVAGSTGDVVVSWTHVGPSDVAYTRSSYDRLNLRAVKK